MLSGTINHSICGTSSMFLSTMSRENSDDFENTARIATLDIYPNPAVGDFVNLELDQFEKNEEVEILVFDNMGNPISVQKVKTDYNGFAKFELQLDDRFKKGVYLIMARTASVKTYKKLIID